MDTLLSIGQAAQLLGGISKYTLEKWLSQGKLPRTKVGARTMILQSDLMEFVSRCNEAKAR
jgi:excisionase family DNA binding protein